MIYLMKLCMKLMKAIKHAPAAYYNYYNQCRWCYNMYSEKEEVYLEDRHMSFAVIRHAGIMVERGVSI